MIIQSKSIVIAVNCPGFFHFGCKRIVVFLGCIWICCDISVSIKNVYTMLIIQIKCINYLLWIPIDHSNQIIRIAVKICGLCVHRTGILTVCTNHIVFFVSTQKEKHAVFYFPGRIRGDLDIINITAEPGRISGNFPALPAWLFYTRCQR